jgi:hypothetical protein
VLVAQVAHPVMLHETVYKALLLLYLRSLNLLDVVHELLPDGHDTLVQSIAIPAVKPAHALADSAAVKASLKSIELITGLPPLVGYDHVIYYCEELPVKPALFMHQPVAKYVFPAETY